MKRLEEDGYKDSDDMVYRMNLSLGEISEL